MRVDIDLKEFCASAISPSRLMSFLFCEAQPLVQRWGHRLIGGIDVKAGSVRHQIDLSWQVEHLGDLEPVEVFTVKEALGYLEAALRGALRKRAVLANTFRVRTFASIVRELVPGRGLFGYPDAVDCCGTVGSFLADSGVAAADDILLLVLQQVQRWGLTRVAKWCR